MPHRYNVGDEVMSENHHAKKHEQPYKGPYHIQQVNTNGTICLFMGVVMDTVNIRCIHPYKTPVVNRGRNAEFDELV